MGGGGGGICSRKVGQPGYLVSERSPPPIGVFFFPFLFFCFFSFYLLLLFKAGFLCPRYFELATAT